MMNTEELESYMKYTADDLNLWQRAYNAIQEIADKCEDFSLAKPLKIPNLQWRPIPPEKEPDGEGYMELFEKMPTLYEFSESPYESDRYLAKAVVQGICSHDDLF